MTRMLKYPLFRDHGYNMIEVLVVALIISILATVPVASLRKAKMKANEVEAVAALNMLAVAYESYNSETRPHRYPHYQPGGQILPEVFDYRDAEEIWDDLLHRSLLPKRFSTHAHDEHNLLARGFRFSIFPFRDDSGVSIYPRYNYAMAMIPFEGSQQKRAIAIFQGDNDGWRRISPRARKIPGSGDLSESKFYTWRDF